MRQVGVPNGIRTRVSALKGLNPRPLDDGDAKNVGRRRDVRPRKGPLATSCNITVYVTFPPAQRDAAAADTTGLADAARTSATAGRPAPYPERRHPHPLSPGPREARSPPRRGLRACRVAASRASPDSTTFPGTVGLVNGWCSPGTRVDAAESGSSTRRVDRWLRLRATEDAALVVRQSGSGCKLFRTSDLAAPGPTRRSLGRLLAAFPVGPAVTRRHACPTWLLRRRNRRRGRQAGRRTRGVGRRPRGSLSMEERRRCDELCGV